MIHQWKVGDKFRCTCSLCINGLTSMNVRVVTKIDEYGLWDNWFFSDYSNARPVESKAETVQAKGDLRFHALLKQLGELYDRKQADYGTPDDPFANYRASEDIGIPAWKNAFMRGIEKVNRIKAFIRNGSLKNEGVEDAFMDLAVCSMIALIEYRETVKRENPS